MSCSAATEKNDAYILNWTNSSGAFFEADTGTTPSTVGELFYQSYTIPSTWPSGIWINATLTGDGNNDLEGSDSANVSATASANSLIITNSTIGGKWLGITSSIQATVKDENGDKIRRRLS